MVHLIISVPLPQILEQIAEVMKVIQQEQISKRIVEQIVDVPVPQIPEQIVDVPVPQVMEETVEAAKSIPQERVQRRTLEETLGVLVLLEVLAASQAVPSRGENGRSPRRAQPTALRSGWAAALSSRSVDIIAAGHQLRSSQDTRHDLALSSVFLALSSSADLPWSALRLSRICRFPVCAPQQINWLRRLWAVAVEWRTLKAVSETSLLRPLVGPLRSNFTC